MSDMYCVHVALVLSSRQSRRVRYQPSLAREWAPQVGFEVESLNDSFVIEYILIATWVVSLLQQHMLVVREFVLCCLLVGCHLTELHSEGRSLVLSATDSP